MYDLFGLEESGNGQPSYELLPPQRKIPLPDTGITRCHICNHYDPVENAIGGVIVATPLIVMLGLDAAEALALATTLASSPEAEKLLEQSSEKCEQVSEDIEGIENVQETLERIARGEKNPHRNDGTVFRNDRGDLPKWDGMPKDYYHEYVHPTPGKNGAGLRRIVIGDNGEIYYSPDHYHTFIRLSP